MVEVGRHDWALVLAAGEGSRLHSLTTGRDGRAIPKQYCSLDGRTSLLGEALHRARAIAAPERVVAIVAADHERWWRDELASLPLHNTIVQPRNRGTAAGVLLPLLSIAERDPDARIVIIPSDHHVADEARLVTSMRGALGQLDRRPDALVLLGITPDETDAEFGWIVPEGTAASGVRRVRQFVEKPPLTVARELAARGGLWNAFIIACTARSLLALYEVRLPRVIAAMRVATTGWSSAAGRAAAVVRLYERLEVADFSRDVLEGAEDRLLVQVVPPCGWSDLGTPERVVQCVARLESRRPARPSGAATFTGDRVVLAQACLAMQ